MKKIIAIIIASVIFLSVLPLCASVSALDTDILTVYPEYDERILRDYDYSVSVTQSGVTKQLTVYNQNRTSELLESRTALPDSERRFCEFAFSGAGVRVDIRVNRSFNYYSVLPSAKNYRTEFNDGVISVWLDSADEYFLIELDNDYNTILSVFADEPEDYSFDKSDPSVLVIDDSWTYGNSDNEYKIPAGVTTLYIAPGSVLCARLIIKTQGFNLCGHGMILDPYSDIFKTDSKKQSPAYVVTVNAKDVTMRDFKVVDAQSFNIVFYAASSNAHVEDVKILSTRMCTDGISTMGCNYFTSEHCFIYNGDDAITFGGSDIGSRINNCYLGTTCGAVHCSKDIPGDVILKNTYVFRADEGCVKNWYNVTNPGTVDRTIASVTFDGLDCMDVINLPWLFSGRNMGVNEKNFRFRDVVVNNVTGSSRYLSEPSGNVIILTYGGTSYLSTYNYNLDITNLIVDGTPIEAVEDVKISNGYPDKNAVTVTNDGTFVCAETEKKNYTVNYKYPLTVKIGSLTAKMRTQPILASGEYLIEYGELCEKLGIEPQDSDYLTEVSGKKWISLDEVNKHISPAYYDSENSCIHIDNVYDSSVNLVREYSAALSRWNEDVAYQSSVTVNADADSTPVYLNTASLNAGMHIMLTDEIKQNGAGIYAFSFDAMSENGVAQTASVSLGFDTTGGRKIEETVEFSGEWKHYEYVFDASCCDIEGVRAIYLAFENTSGANYRILFKNMSFNLMGYDTPRGGKTVTVTQVIDALNSQTVPAFYGTAISELSVPLNGSMFFEGWYTDAEKTMSADGLLTKDCTLYAKWSDGVKINYWAGAALYQTGTAKKDAPLGMLIPQPEVDGFCSAGWFRDEALTQRISSDDIAGDEITLYAGYYPDVCDLSNDDLNAYIAYATHKLSSVDAVHPDSFPSGDYNRTAVCTVEGGKTYKVIEWFDLRFRVGTVASLEAGKVVENLVTDELDTNGFKPTGKTRELTITAGADDTTLLIFYYTSKGSLVNAPSIRKTIGVYNTSVAVQAFTAPEPPTEPTTEPSTEPTTEPTTEPSTEPTTEPTTEPATEPITEPTTKPTATEQCSHFCHSDSGFMRFIYRIACFFWKLLSINQYCSCGASHY